MLRVEFFGKPQIIIDGLRIDNLKSAKALFIVCYLALTKQTTSRAKLSTWLWPESEFTPRSATMNFNTEWSRLRRIDGLKPYLLDAGDGIAFNNQLPLETDLELFESYLTRGEESTLKAAVVLYRDNFLQDLLTFTNIAAGADVWLTSKRTTYIGKIADVLKSLAVHHAYQFRYDLSYEWLDRWIELDPTSEDAHLLKIIVLALQKRIDSAMQLYTAFKAMMRSERRRLQPETQRWISKLRHGKLTNAVLAQFHGPYLIPSRHAPFLVPFHDIHPAFAREQDTQNLKQEVMTLPPPKLICLSGMGGIGKTMLAAQLAQQLQPDFPDGVLWADLSASTVRDILCDWLDALQEEYPITINDGLLARLFRRAGENKKILYILDDLTDERWLEHLLPTASSAVVIITSRMQRFSKINPVVRMVQLLSKDGSLELVRWIIKDKYHDVDQEMAYKLCEILEFLPLAINIALRMLMLMPDVSISELVSQLASTTELIGTFDVPYDQTSDNEAVPKGLRHVFERSWQLLTPEQRQLFDVLGIFDNRPFTLDAATYLQQGLRGDTNKTRQQLTWLIGLSLLSAEGRRYRLHTLLADFARQHLREAGILKQSYQQWINYYLRFVREKRASIDQISQEWNMITLCIQRAFEVGLELEAMALVEQLIDLWFLQGRYAEARISLTSATNAAEVLGQRNHQAKFLLALGRLSLEQAEFKEAFTHIHTSRGLYLDLRQAHEESEEEQAEYARQLATCLTYLGRLAVSLGDYPAADELFGQSLDLKRQLRDAEGMVEAIAFWANRHLNADEEGRLERAEGMAAHIMSLLSEIGGNAAKGLAEIRALVIRIDVALQTDSLEIAEGLCLQALTRCQEIGEDAELTVVLLSLSTVYLKQGRLTDSLERTQQAIDKLKRMNDRLTLARVHYIRMAAACLADDARKAKESYSEALSLYRLLGFDDEATATEDLYQRLCSDKPSA